MTKNTLRDKRRKNRKYAVQKLGGVCVRCGTTEDLTFDHIDNKNAGRNKKPSRQISQLVSGSRAKLDAELVQCQILCRPCHGLKTVHEDVVYTRKHGTIAEYNNHGCRCDGCKQAWSDYMKNRNRDKIRGSEHTNTKSFFSQEKNKGRSHCP